MFLDIDKKDPQKIAAVEDTGNQITYGDLCKFSKEMAEYMPQRSVVFCLCENTIGSLIGYIGCLSHKIVPLLLALNTDKELLERLIETYEPQFFWCPEEKELPVATKEIFKTAGYKLVRTSYEQYEIHDQLSLLLATSGSTGSPKLVRYKYGNLEANAKNVAKVFGWTEKERPVIDLPMQYTMGLNVINTHLYVGATLIMTTQNLVSREFWNYIEEQKATNFTGVPFSYEVFFRLRFNKKEFPDLTTLAEGGGKLTDKMFMDLIEYSKKHNKRFCATFGTTETSARLAYLDPERAEEKCGSIGKAIPEGELFLIDKDGNEIQEMEAEGEMGYRGPNVTMGYGVCKEDLKLGDVWNGTYRTGDIARRDSEGFYYIVGRISRFLKIYGHRISLDQCEKLIKTKFEIDCACAGTDKCMKIFITEDSYSKEILRYLSDKLHLMQNVMKVYVLESIPRNESGKIKYAVLNKMV